MTTGMVQQNQMEHGLYDTLTGACSRACFHDRYSAGVALARSTGSPLALCVFDLDYFKSINDAYGHRRGDQVLTALVARLQPQLRATDLLFRYGGDEFVLLLPETSKQEAIAIAQRLLDSVRKSPFPGEPPLSLSLSIGVAALPEDGVDTETLFEVADKRNYLAKRQGRGCVVGHASTVAGDSLAAEISRLVEREDAEETLNSFLTRMPECRRGILTIAGPSGSGRTRLLRATLEAAARQGWATVALTGCSDLKSQPYGVWQRADWADGQSPRTAMPAEAIARTLAQNGQQPLLIAVDNLGHVDRATRYLLRELMTAPDIPCLAIAYVEDAPFIAGFLPEEVPFREGIVLKPLSRTGVTIWLRNLLHWEPTAEFIDWLYHETGGRPARLRAALTALRSRETLILQEGGGWRVSGDYRQVALNIAEDTPWLAAPHNLPSLLTEFVGRDHARREVAALLDRGRLATVLGPGGFGKTRLAIQVARELLCDFEDGVWFVPLAALHCAEQIPEAIAGAMGIKEESDKPLIVTLKSCLAIRRTLIVLDNCEHLVESCAQLAAELIHACGTLHILTTSRHALNIAGEQTWRIHALTLPELDELPPDGAGLLSVVSRCEAVQLFIKRAEEAQKTFQLTSENALCIARICTQLEGIPLALELAAARVRALPIEQIARRLDDRFRLLTGGNRNALPHHQTLKALIDWSYDLLSEQERCLLRRLSVFAGGGTLDAVERVCADSDAEARALRCQPPPIQSSDSAGDGGVSPSEIREWEVLDLLTQLVDKSLVMYVEKNGQGRYRLLETIRQYAYEKLTASDDPTRLHERHLAYFLAYAEQAEERLFGPNQAACLDQLEIECHNVRAALDWCQGRINTSNEGLRLTAAIERFWDLRGHLTEGRARCEAVLARDDAAARTAARAKTLLTLGRLARRQNDLAVATVALEESFAIAQELGDRQLIAQGLRSLGSLAFTQGDNGRAQRLIQESLTRFHELADDQGIGYSLCMAGIMASAAGDFPLARQCHQEGLALFRKTGNTQGIAMELCNLGEVTLVEGDLATARACQEECLRLDHELGDRVGMAYPLENLASIAIQQREFERATRLMGAADALRAATGTSIFADERDRYDADLKTLRAQLGAAKFGQLWDSGRKLTLEQMIAYALH